jgi:hypothetical protein
MDFSSRKAEVSIEPADKFLGDQATDLRKFWEEMRAVRMEFSLFRSTMIDLTEAIKPHSTRLSGLEERVEVLESKACNCVTSELERGQDLLANDIEIASFPEVGNENTTHVFQAIANKLGVQLDERDVVSEQRVVAPRGATGATADTNGSRPRPIAVRLARRAVRDVLLQAARVRRHLTTVDMTVPDTHTSFPSRPFYLNERLIYHNGQLFHKVREIAKRCGWRYVWTREGRIFVRQQTGKARHRIRSELDLTKVFGTGSVRNVD